MRRDVPPRTASAGMDRPLGGGATSPSRASAYHGFRGDTISSALAAAWVPYLGRSFKYHRPRGILSFANHDSNALFQVDGVPNVRGDVTLLREGMQRGGGQHLRRARARQGANPGSIRALGCRWGFTTRRFIRSAGSPAGNACSARSRGSGTVALDAARRTTPKRYGFCDVLVIGGGPSGLAAALEAGGCGRERRIGRRGVSPRRLGPRASAASERCRA